MICSVGKQNGSGHRDSQEVSPVLDRTADYVETPLTVVVHSDPISCITPSECWESVHKRGVRACHRWEGFRAGSLACVACSRRPAERKCIPCNDLLCLTCFTERWVEFPIDGDDPRFRFFGAQTAPDEPRCRSTGALSCVVVSRRLVSCVTAEFRIKLSCGCLFDPLILQFG